MGHGIFAGAQALYGFGGDGYGREARRAAQTFLDATEGHVDAGGIDVDGHGSQGGHAVDNGDGFDGVGGARDRGQILARAGGCFGVHEGNGVGFFAIDEGGGFGFA